MRVFVYWLSSTIFYMLLGSFFKLRIFKKGRPPAPPYIIASNHASFFDPPLIGASFYGGVVDFMAKKELFENPVFSIWARTIGCIPLSRDENSTAAIREALKRLEKGRRVCIFPEGTRSLDGNLQKAKRGTGFLIAKANVPVVPVYIGGSGAALPKGGRPKIGTRINILVGEAVQPSEFSRYLAGEKADYDAISDLVMDRIADLKNTDIHG